MLKSIRSLQFSIRKYQEWLGSQFDGNVNLLSYNILSQEHLERNTFLYEKVPLKYQSWEYRSRMLREQFFNWKNFAK